jgi:hypothetical protein
MTNIYLPRISKVTDAICTSSTERSIIEDTPFNLDNLPVFNRLEDACKWVKELISDPTKIHPHFIRCVLTQVAETLYEKIENLNLLLITAVALDEDLDDDLKTQYLNELTEGVKDTALSAMVYTKASIAVMNYVLDHPDLFMETFYSLETITNIYENFDTIFCIQVLDLQ